MWEHTSAHDAYTRCLRWHLFRTFPLEARGRDGLENVFYHIKRKKERRDSTLDASVRATNIILSIRLFDNTTDKRKFRVRM